MTTLDFKHPAQLQDMLFSGLTWSGVDWRHARTPLADIFADYQALVGQGAYALPWVWFLDLHLMLSHQTLPAMASEQRWDHWPDDERPLRLHYEQRLLARIPALPKLNLALEHCNDATPRRRLLQRLAHVLILDLIPHNLLINPALLRRTRWPAQAPTDDALADASERFLGRAQTPLWRDHMHALVEGAIVTIHWPTVLRPIDHFEISHWTQLQNDALRLGCQALIQVDDHLGPAPLHKLPRIDANADVDTYDQDEGTLPAGGFAGLSSRGHLSSLVPSELIYLDVRAHGINLFDARLLEGELLYFLRDDDILRQRRRRVDLILDMDPRWHTKSRGYPHNFAAMAQGLCIRIIHDLCQALAHDALTLHSHHLTARGDVEAIHDEHTLFNLVLDDLIETGQVTTALLSDLDLNTLDDDTASQRVLIFAHERTHHWRTTLALSPLHGMVIDVATTRSDTDFALPLAGLDHRGLNTLRHRLLAAILGPPDNVV